MQGDVICVFSQFGEVEDFNLVRDETTGKSRGFAFLKYEDARSCILSVDNLTGSKVSKIVKKENCFYLSVKMCLVYIDASEIWFVGMLVPQIIFD
jgi:RNA recognition motif-containing protein